MFNKQFRITFGLLLSCLVEISFISSVEAQNEMKVNGLRLQYGWQIQSTAFVKETGDILSMPAYTTLKNWYRTSVPSTILAALIDAKVYPDPYFGMNFRLIPGMSYPPGEMFSNILMPPESPFINAWWYRTEFDLPQEFSGKISWLHFDGINFRANIWLNGRLIANSNQVAGTFRLYEFDVTGIALPGKKNVLAVEVYPPQPDDLQIHWVDNNPTPADKNMGIIGDVTIRTTGPVVMSHSQVISRLDLPSMNNAHLTVTTELNNATSKTVKGVLKGKIEGINFEQKVNIEAGENKEVRFSPGEFKQLNLPNPRIWWPVNLGQQNLYLLSLEFITEDQISDLQNVQFGIREATSELTSLGHRLFFINGRRVQIRGAGWWPDMLLRRSPERQEWEIRYARAMNLNALRMDGKFDDDNLLNLCDKYGIMLLPGWCCCDHWERQNKWDDEDYIIAAESTRDQLKKFRTHPSVISWMMGDDYPPIAKVEKMYLDIIKECEWQNTYLTAAGGKPSAISSRTGFNMGKTSGHEVRKPYLWIPPAYWLMDRKCDNYGNFYVQSDIPPQPEYEGGAYGFNTETSPSASIPPIESIRKILPETHLWPPNETWDYHGSGGEFSGLHVKVFTDALNSRLGKADDIEDFAFKAQLMNYESQRAMYEAYGQNKYFATGLIHEWLNNAWPSFSWNLYDYFLRPGGSYFGVKKACEPLHIQYADVGRSVYIVNSYHQNFSDMKVTAKVYDLSMNEKFSKQATLNVPSDSAVKVFIIPDVKDISTTYFVHVRMENAKGKIVSSGLYWLSAKPDVPDWDNMTWCYTPAKSYADLTGLKILPPVKVNVTGKIMSGSKNEDSAELTIENPSNQLAFFIRLRISTKANGEEILPVLWEDNYFSLMPGETRQISAIFPSQTAKKIVPVVEVEGWNVARFSQSFVGQ